MKKVLIIHGPSMTMIGVREPEIYGRRTFSDLIGYIEKECKSREIVPTFFQSNHEGDIVDAIIDAYGKFDGIVINPAAYTHTSIAIGDALRTVGLPCVEVHLSDIQNREDYRKISYTAPACIGRIYGLGFDGYAQALDIISKNI